MTAKEQIGLDRRRGLDGSRILLGVTGSIAAYKGADLASRLTQRGALVDVVMTGSALEFVTPLTFRSLTHRPVVTRLFDVESESSMEHIALAESSGVIVVAPATADLKVIERFTRADEGTLLYEFTIDDPTTYTQPWGGEIPFKKMGMGTLVHEYACHEANYALFNILSGARAQERENRQN